MKKPEDLNSNLFYLCYFENVLNHLIFCKYLDVCFHPNSLKSENRGFRKMDGDPFSILKNNNNNKNPTTKQNLKSERPGFIGFTNGEGTLTDEEK